MFTADDARKLVESHLDERLRDAVEDRSVNGIGAYIRVYSYDSYKDTIKEELEKRGFKNIKVPDIVLQGDVYFEW